MRSLFLVSMLLIPAVVGAAGVTKLQKQIDLGGGYFVPAAPSNLNVANAKFGVQLPEGLNCGGIDWKGQLTQQLNLGLSLQDAKQLGQSAVAASASYMAASLRPTWYSALQNALKQAQAKVDLQQTDCRAIEANLIKNDPLDLFGRKQQAAKAGELVAAGATMDGAVSQSSAQPVKWSLSQSIGSSDLSQEAKANLAATLGDIHFAKNGGVVATGGDRPAAEIIDQAYRNSRREIGGAIYTRLMGDDDCSVPLFGDPKTEASDAALLLKYEKELAKATADTPPAINRDQALKLAMRRELAKKPDQWSSCEAVQAYRVYLPEDRAELIRVLTDAQTLRGIGLVLRRTQSELANLKLQKQDQADVIDRLSPLPQLEQAYADLQQEIDERGRLAAVLQQATANAEKANKEQAKARRDAEVRYWPQPKMPSITGGR